MIYMTDFLTRVTKTSESALIFNYITNITLHIWQTLGQKGVWNVSNNHDAQCLDIDGSDITLIGPTRFPKTLLSQKVQNVIKPPYFIH